MEVRGLAKGQAHIGLNVSSSDPRFSNITLEDASIRVVASSALVTINKVSVRVRVRACACV